MNRASRSFLWIGIATLVMLGPRETVHTAGSDTRRPELADQYGKLPLTFEANRGQTDRRVQFLARGNGYALFLTPTEAVLSLRGPDDARRSTRQASVLDKATSLRSKRTAVLRMTLVGANPKAIAKGLEELSGKSNYLIGRVPSRWRTNVPNYGKVRFGDVYRGVDLVYYGNQRQLEYDFVLAPGADPTAIALRFTGADRLQIDTDGELALHIGTDEVRWEKPLIYQEIGGVRHAVSGQYVRKGKSTVGFEVGSYDTRHALVIDPTLGYSTYLGGSGYDVGTGIAVDAAGHAYLTGTTFSSDFPTTTGAFRTSLAAGQDVFVAKFDTSKFGRASRVYATYLGGGGTDTGHGIAVDSLGNAYVTGGTNSIDFPVTASAYQAAYQGGPGRFDAYVAKLNAAGNALLYSTYLGGDLDDLTTGIAVDSSNPPNGYVYVTGNTTSNNFPTLNGFDSTGYGFVTKLNTTLSGSSSLMYSTYLGFVTANGIAADASGNVYVTGQWTCVQSGVDLCGGNDHSSPFVMKIGTDALGLNSLIYTTVLDAGYGTSAGNGVAVDSSVPANVYVTGYTNTISFPGAASSSIQPTNRGGNDAFVAMLDGAGTLVHSTYLGGSGDEQGNAIAVDTSGNIYVTGQTNSGDFHVANAVQSNYNGGPLDAFVTKISPLCTALVYSTYLGGSGSDWGAGIAADSSGSAYITGGTSLSTNFPVANAFQFSLGGNTDAFLTTIIDDTPPPSLVLQSIQVKPANPSIPAGTVQQFSATGTYSDGSTQDITSSVTWASASPAVASITAAGVATAVGSGASTIAATLGGITGSTLLTVTSASTTTALAASANPSVVGQAVTFTAAVAGFNPGGTMMFKDGSTVLGTGALNGAGVATFTTSALTIGSHSITANYSGDANNLSSVSGVLTQVVNRSNTMTALSASPNPAKVSQAVAFTATVAGYTPTGTITFTVDGGAQVIGPVSLSAGTATITLSGFSAGLHTIVASYSGDSNNLSSSSPTLTQVVDTGAGKVPTTTTLTVSTNTPAVGETVTLTATVSGDAPTGTVTFYDFGTVVAVVPLNPSGVASTTITVLTKTGHKISAAYSGDAHNLPSTSPWQRVQAQ